VTRELDAVRSALVPLDGGAHDYDRLLARVGSARFVLLGEASHGTHEFYVERSRVTERLVTELGFDAVAVESDWPDAFRTNRFVRGEGDDGDAEEALRGFRRFPTWMWRNTDLLDFVGWLRGANDVRDRRSRVGFYGLDLYSLYASIDAVVAHLDRVDPDAAARARARYACFDHFGADATAYAYASALNLEASCEREVKQQLVEMRARNLEHAALDVEEDLDAEQNARVVKNAEAYYRTMLQGSVVTWNIRDRHMADTLAAVVQHLDRRLGRPARVVVWAHNTHVGDARATEAARSGELTLGQLARERYGTDVFLVGMTTYAGTVTAASDWERPAERKPVRPALEGSFEELFHQAGVPRFLLLSPALPRARRLERAIGVVYRPETERTSHWGHARLADQFDAVIHVDHTRAVEPIERIGDRTPDAPETYPFTV
jgi:erythromycin esterase-like protein